MQYFVNDELTNHLLVLNCLTDLLETCLLIALFVWFHLTAREIQIICLPVSSILRKNAVMKTAGNRFICHQKLVQKWEPSGCDLNIMKILHLVDH